MGLQVNVSGFSAGRLEGPGVTVPEGRRDDGDHLSPNCWKFVKFEAFFLTETMVRRPGCFSMGTLPGWLDMKTCQRVDVKTGPPPGVRVRD